MQRAFTILKKTPTLINSQERSHYALYIKRQRRKVSKKIIEGKEKKVELERKNFEKERKEAEEQAKKLRLQHGYQE